jgi:NTP pyrophosphatase (non-canonical NTP hydrolase)
MGRQLSKVLVGMENEEVGEVGEKVEKGKETIFIYFLHDIVLLILV